MSVLKLFYFGGLRMYKDDQPITAPLLKKTQAFFAYLAISKNKSFSRDKLCAIFWPESGEAQAKYNLRYTLWVLRTGLGFPEYPQYEFVITYQDQCKFNPESNYWLDTEEFEKKLILAQNLKIDDAARIEYLTEAVNLYHGDFLDGFFIKGSWEFENWQRIQRERFSQEFTKAVRNLADLLVSRKEPRRAIELYNKSLLVSPFREDFYQELIRLYLLIGDRTKAIEQYERYREVLKREMQLSPTSEIQELRRSISSATGSPKSGLPNHDEGRRDQPPTTEGAESERRRAESGGEVNFDELLKEVPAEWELRHPIGVETSFVGREKEIAKLNALLSAVERANALEAVIIKGELGIGKTRLIEEFIRQNEARAEIIFGASSHIFSSNPADVLLEGIKRWLKRKLVSGMLTEGEGAIEHSDKIKLALLSSQKTAETALDREWLFEAAVKFFSFVASQKPLILVVEDLQWTSPLSFDLLYYLIAKCLQRKILFIGSSRSEEEETKSLAIFIGKLQRIIRVKKILLSRLSYEDVRVLLEKYQSQSPGILDWAEAIHLFSDGNPFIISLLIGEYFSPQFNGKFTIPETISDIVTGRLKNLSDKAIYLLKLAAVMDIAPKQKDLLTVSKIEENEFASLSTELIKRGFLREKADEGEVRFVFAHPFLQELILSQMTLTEKNIFQEMCTKVIRKGRGE